MDKYSQTMLTIIAICLVWIAFKDTRAIEGVHAGLVGSDVELVNGAIAKHKPTHTNYPGLNYLQRDYWWNGGPIPVTIVDKSLPVVVESMPTASRANLQPPTELETSDEIENRIIDEIYKVGFSVGINICRIEGCGSKEQAEKALQELQAILSEPQLESFNKGVNTWEGKLCYDHAADAKKDNAQKTGSCQQEFGLVQQARAKLQNLVAQQSE